MTTQQERDELRRLAEATLIQRLQAEAYRHANETAELLQEAADRLDAQDRLLEQSAKLLNTKDQFLSRRILAHEITEHLKGTK